MKQPYELSSHNFRMLIGAPLLSTIEAQALAAKSCADFIYNTGFEISEKYEGDKLVTRSIPKTLRFSSPPATGTSSALNSSQEFSVPLLSLIPIPNLRINEVEIKFDARITTLHAQENGLSNLVEDKQPALWAYVAKKKRKQNQLSGNDYSMHVRIKVVQEELPPKLQALLDAL